MRVIHSGIYSWGTLFFYFDNDDCLFGSFDATMWMLRQSTRKVADNAKLRRGREREKVMRYCRGVGSSRASDRQLMQCVMAAYQLDDQIPFPLF
mmetsp:Transcript_42676/g.103220  ORF Transcript_42676/g.103220 Transcript_42676/m.103220 type:complete len:94 (-) Transcript_42676:1275-1556(-)